MPSGNGGSLLSSLLCPGEKPRMGIIQQQRVPGLEIRISPLCGPKVAEPKRREFSQPTESATDGAQPGTQGL